MGYINTLAGTLTGTLPEIIERGLSPYGYAQPLHIRLFTQTQHACLSLHKRCGQASISARLLHAGVTAVTVGAQLTVIPLGLVESALGLVAALALFPLQLLTRGKIALLDRWTFKTTAYGLCSFASSLYEAYQIVHRIFPFFSAKLCLRLTTRHFHAAMTDNDRRPPSSHTEIMAFNYGLYITAAVTSRMLSGMLPAFTLREEERNHQLIQQSVYSAYTLLHSLPMLGRGLLRNLPRDIDFYLRAEHGFQNFVTAIHNIIESEPEHLAFLQNPRFLHDIWHDIGNAREDLGNFLIDDVLTNLITILGGALEAVHNERDGLVFNLNDLNEAETAYQAKLQGYVKRAYHRMLEVQDGDGRLLIRFMEDASDSLEGFYPGATFPLAYFTQLEELEDAEVTCPENFESTSLQENSGARYAQIQSGKEQLGRLNGEEKTALYMKLMQGSDFTWANSDIVQERQEVVDELFTLITELASHLHQGPLLSHATLIINRDGINPSGNNLFVQAWQAVAAGDE